jgi:ABC-2 type transport system ATP-binding protein
MNAIEIDNVVKTFGQVAALKGVSLSVGERELFGIIGPDGAGKTTLMRAICTLIAPDSGSILVLGMDGRRQIVAIRSRLGYMPQRFSLYQDLSVEQNLRFFADLFQVSRPQRQERMERLYGFSRLAPFKKRKAGALSGGMKQKLALSCALIHTPEVLILDEPTVGVDPLSRQEFWEILRSLQQQGKTILVSTAYMDEADQCDRVALMHRGRIIVSGTPAEVKAGFRYPLYRARGRDVRMLRRFFAGLPQVHATQLFGDAVHISFQQQPDERDWMAWKRDSAENLQGWEPRQPSMEDVFMEYSGEAI